MELHGKKGKYTSKLRLEAKLFLVVLILFLTGVSGFLLYEGIIELKEEIFFSMFLFFIVAVLVGLMIFIFKNVYTQTKFISEQELTNTGYKITNTDTKTNKTFQTEILFSQIEKCLISPHSSYVYRANQTGDLYQMQATLNIVYKNENDVRDVFRFIHHSEEELKPWFEKMKQYDVPIEITDYELKLIPHKTYLKAVTEEVPRTPYIYNGSLSDLNLLKMSRDKPNDYTIPETKRKLVSGKLVTKKISNKALFIAHFIACMIYTILFHQEFTNDEFLTPQAEWSLYIVFSIFLILYLYGLKEIKIWHYLKYAPISIGLWVAGVAAVNIIFLDVPAKFIYSLSGCVAVFLIFSPGIGLLAYIVRAFKPAVYHEKYQKDLEKIEEIKGLNG